MAHHPTTPTANRPLLVVLLVGLLLTLAACGGDDDTAADDAEPDQATAAPAEDADGEAVVAVSSTDLGEVLVDADGLTLYGFTNDSGGTSSCTDGCAATWPPVIVEEGFAVGDGLVAGTFSTTERDDGSLQLVAGDWPLYRYAADAAAGDTNGQGVGDVWFVVGADGQLIEDSADSAAATGPGTDY